jgi:hypothetical protein
MDPIKVDVPIMSELQEKNLSSLESVAIMEGISILRLDKARCATESLADGLGKSPRTKAPLPVKRTEASMILPLSCFL